MADRPVARHDAGIGSAIRRHRELAGPAMTAEAGKACLPLHDLLGPAEFADRARADVTDAERLEMRLRPLQRPPVLAHGDHAGAHPDAGVEKTLKVPHRACVAAAHFRHRVVLCRIGRIDRCREAHAVRGAESDGFVGQARQVGIDLDEGVAELDGAPQQRVEVSVERRLATDELDFPAAERERIGHDPIVVRAGQDIAIGAVRRRFRVAVDALQVAAVGQLKPKKIEPLA